MDRIGEIPQDVLFYLQKAVSVLKALGWSVHPPAPKPRPRALDDYLRDEYLMRAPAFGWRGGSPAKGCLPADDLKICEMRAAARQERDRATASGDVYGPHRL